MGWRTWCWSAQRRGVLVLVEPRELHVESSEGDNGPALDHRSECGGEMGGYERKRHDGSVVCRPAVQPRIQSVDLGQVLGSVAPPKTLVAISNGLGRVTLIGYQPSTTFARADAEAGQPWTNLMPLSVSVVAAATNFDSLGHQYVSRFSYHQGYYDPGEKQFRGFAIAEQIDLGDATAPTLVTRSYFDTGRDYEPMKGKVLRVTTEREDGKVFNDVFTYLDDSSGAAHDGH